MIKKIRKLKAKILRTFVADCPSCHKHFYGHQGIHHHVNLNEISYRYVCSGCYKRLNKKELTVK